MDWTLDKARPICQQICEKFCVAIASGEYRAGDRLLSVREVALLAGVNPNTVQKSFEELERQGVVHSIPYSGWYVNENPTAAGERVEALKQLHCREFLQAMSQLGCEPGQALVYLTATLEERKGEQL